MRAGPFHALPALALALSLGLGVSGCTAPVAYGRTGRVLSPGRWRISSATNVGLAVAKVHAQNLTRTGSDDGTHVGLSASQYDSAGDLGLAENLLGWLFSWQGSASIGVFSPCEVGIYGGFVRVGGEARCGLLPQASPVALAASVGAALQDPLGRLFRVRDRARGAELRAGLDMSLERVRHTPFVGVYVGRIPFERHVPIDDSVGVEGLQARLVRDEWRLSLPIGLRVESDDGARAMVYALIPELTVASRKRGPVDLSYYPDATRSFDQVFALYLAMKFEGLP